MNNIDTFITKCKNIANYNDEVYPYQHYDCEISLAFKCLFTNNLGNQSWIDTWKNVFHKKYFELHHPTKNHILTRAVFSHNPQDSLVSFTFFIDSGNQFPWLAITAWKFGDIIITLDDFFWTPVYNKNSNDLGFRFKSLKILQSLFLSRENLSFKDSEFCLRAYNLEARPYHYFYDSLICYHRLSLQDIPLSKKKQNFFILKHTPLINNAPLEIPYKVIHHSQQNGQCFVAEMNQTILQQSLQDFEACVDSEDKLDRFDKEVVSQYEIAELIPQLAE